MNLLRKSLKRVPRTFQNQTITTVGGRDDDETIGYCYLIQILAGVSFGSGAFALGPLAPSAS